MRRLLFPHPSSTPGAVSSIDVAISLSAEGDLSLRYRVTGEMAGLTIPERDPVLGDAVRDRGRTYGLWRMTCFEVFVRRAGQDAYHEFNFSPSGRWAAYSFDRYREGGRNADAVQAIDIDARIAADQLEIASIAPLSRLGVVQPGEDHAIVFAITAIIESSAGTLSYWALAHPPGAPDFHHAAGFALVFPYTEAQ